ncbi:HD domain-containing protein [Candidatus Berkelbacteria bacterium]|nr:HD domain-containing protein [Candidatus Berkelbacteria bacterium]
MMNVMGVGGSMELVEAIARRVGELGGRTLLVGGAVRDELLGLSVVDVDLEVYGLSADQLLELLKSFGRVDEVGRAFAVWKLTIPEGQTIDISLPRLESKTGSGHKGFVVTGDQELSIEDATRRRDFTINAILKDPLTGEFLDLFSGRSDLAGRILRVVNPATFGDDPLRAMRALQLAARFNLTIEPGSAKLIKAQVPELLELPRERLGAEWRKLLLSDSPSVGLEYGLTLGIFAKLYPELVALRDTEQERGWHPEGDVFVHTCLVVDKAAKIASREKLHSDDRLILTLSALCHDLGKPSTTIVKDGRMRSPGHQEAGGPLAKEFCDKLALDQRMTDKVVKLVEHHLAPAQLYKQEAVLHNPVGDGAFRRLARRLSPASIVELLRLWEADHFSRGEFTGQADFLAGPWVKQRAEKLDLLYGPPSELISGGELIALGFTPGPILGELQRLAEELYSEGKTKEEIVEIVKQKAPHQ